MGIPFPESHDSALYTELEMPHLHISLNVCRDLGGAGEGWGQKSLLTLREIMPHNWIQNILLVCRNADPAFSPSECFSSSLISGVTMECQSSLQVLHFFTCSFFFFFWLGIVPQDCPLSLFPRTQMLLPPNRQRQSYLIDKILLDKILLKCHLPLEFNPNITPHSGTMTFWHQPT